MEENSREGLKLVFADSERAVVEYHGEQIELGLSTRVGAIYTALSNTVSIPLDTAGEYWARGYINGRSVNFLVDTGATVIAMSSVEATRLGIDFMSAPKTGVAETAQGRALSHFVDLPKVEVGGIQVAGVRAAIIEGSYPRGILLGMSFLRQVEMLQKEGILMLRAK